MGIGWILIVVLVVEVSLYQLAGWADKLCGSWWMARDGSLDSYQLSSAFLFHSV